VGKALVEVAEAQLQQVQVVEQAALDLLELQQAHLVEQDILGPTLVSLMLQAADTVVSLSYQ
jgi:hypothetical protein